ncbi:lysine-2,3-aminomutase-like protein [Pseudogemmobacter humi]|uniref:L-lysine 2,3-aminomutase n=1 Tax=Pseudogemmobacter humi TaxID=2483812 RepID=A0A3P5XMR8_9RHOB|nr:lysine-2,3-aminomutase-like protein [Pseudogemmobacter humi]VDC31611.1 L-lysine 2,3-aminomutase [Pseudogemmobacter humi]
MSRIERPARALTGSGDLIREGLAASGDRAMLDAVAGAFRIRISPEMAALPAEGVRAQFVPQAAELGVLPEELADPIGDDAHRPVQGLTHRYPDRVILHATQTCEVYCRFCFRREAVGEAGALAEAEFAKVLDYLRAHPQIHEVILTGGDPMVLSVRRLKDMLDRLAAIPSVQVIRFHTRIPVVAPGKITAALVAALDIRPAVWVVVHTNHPGEITPEAEAAFRRLTRAGVPLLSQTVLLKGVNADPDTLEALFRALIRNRVKPYYLHHPDLAKGTAHFRLPISEGQKIVAALRGRISGTALPAYILDIPGGHGKVPIGPEYLEPQPDGGWIVTDPQGRRHSYRDL